MGSKKFTGGVKSLLRSPEPQRTPSRRAAPANRIHPMSDDELARAARGLARRHAPFRAILRAHGVPPMWAREAGFPTLLHIILEQQVSLASARAAFDRLLEAASPLTPRAFLGFDDDQLKEFGFSRQKTRYGRELAHAVLSGSLDLESLHHLPDDVVSERLREITGIGVWTADIYLLMVLLRPDIWPSGDLALATAAHAVFELPQRPSDVELREMSEAWRPWRAVAARLLWHQYLCERGRSG